MSRRARNGGGAFVKYNTLLEYEEYLRKSSTPQTATRYRQSVEYLLKDQYLLDCKKLDIDMVLKKFENMKYKSDYSRYKNAFLKFCQFQNIKIDNEKLLKLNLMKLEKKKKHRKLKAVDLKDIKNHLRVIQDKKLKLSFETLLATGLRVSELSQITKDDCHIDSDKIVLSFIGKGGNPESVTIHQSEHETLFTNLLDLIGSTEKKVFYSANYLQTKATEKGFACHDLRRAFAKLDYQKHKDINRTKKALRHTNVKNTKKYLHSKVKI